jgi:hypothetical protein
MKLNREKIAALLALAVLALGMKGVVLGFLSPTRGVRTPDVSIPKRVRDVLPRKYRTFTEEGELPRNPFAFSEGWQPMEPPPLPPPPLPPVPRVLPALGLGPSAVEAGFLYQDRPPPEAQPEKEEEAK